MNPRNGSEPEARRAHRHLRSLRQRIAGAFLTETPPEEVAAVLQECLRAERAEVRLKTCRLYLQHLGRFTKLAAGNDPSAPRTVPRPMPPKLLEAIEDPSQSTDPAPPEADGS